MTLAYSARAATQSEIDDALARLPVWRGPFLAEAAR
jgi:hypothetical protein